MVTGAFCLARVSEEDRFLKGTLTGVKNTAGNQQCIDVPSFCRSFSITVTKRRITTSILSTIWPY